MDCLKKIIFFASLCFVIQAYAETRVNVVGLFKHKALLMINGSGPFYVKAGQIKNGVKLVSANSKEATLIIEGRRQVVGMGSAVSIAASSTSSRSSTATNGPVFLYADSAGHFFGDLVINNGTTLKYLVDSGATVVVMNSADAKAANVKYDRGKKIKVATANGVVDAYPVLINTLKIGSIVFHNVQANVIDGASPPFVLLGMSVQNRLKMTRENSTLTLMKKY